MKRAIPVIRTLGIAAAVCLAATWAFAGDTVVEEIVARVNNQIITRSELQRSREQMLNEARQQGVAETDPRVQESDKNLLRDMIDLQLLVQKGADLGVNVDTDLVKRLDEMRKDMSLDSMEGLEKAAQQQGVNFEDFKLNLKNNLIRQEVIQREVASKVQVTGDEEKQFYEQHKAEMTRPEEVRLSEILVAPQVKEGEEPTPEALAAAEQKANQALADLKGGKTFEEVAKQVSSGPTASQGGDLGYFKRGAMSKELEEKAFAMQAGDITDVIRTKQGFVVLKVTEHTQAGTPVLKKVEPQVRDAIIMQKMQPQLREYLTKLREDAFIDIKPGFVDTGASPNQTKPITMASVGTSSETQKPAKKKKRFGVF